MKMPRKPATATDNPDAPATGAPSPAYSEQPRTEAPEPLDVEYTFDPPPIPALIDSDRPRRLILVLPTDELNPSQWRDALARLAVGLDWPTPEFRAVRALRAALEAAM